MSIFYKLSVNLSEEDFIKKNLLKLKMSWKYFKSASVIVNIDYGITKGRLQFRNL